MSGRQTVFYSFTSLYTARFTGLFTSRADSFLGSQTKIKAHMIHLSTIPVENKAQYGSWQSQLSQCKISTADLLNKLGLNDHPLVDEEAERLFELRVPPRYLSLIHI